MHGTPLPRCPLPAPQHITGRGLLTTRPRIAMSPLCASERVPHSPLPATQHDASTIAIHVLIAMLLHVTAWQRCKQAPRSALQPLHAQTQAHSTADTRSRPFIDSTFQRSTSSPASSRQAEITHTFDERDLRVACSRAVAIVAAAAGRNWRGEDASGACRASAFAADWSWTVDERAGTLANWLCRRRQ